MPAHTSVARRFQLFDQTVTTMAEQLQPVRAPAQMLRALGWGMDTLEATLATTSARTRAKIACHAGCDACCSVPVDAQAHDVFFAAHHIQVNFSPVALTDVLTRIEAHRARVTAFAVGARATSRQPCALLAAGSCTIYDGRPKPCRTHHSSDAAVCAANQADPSVDVSKVYVPALRARLFAVMLGLDEAIEAVGYDERCYDFGSALHVALTDSFSLMRWMRRGEAFPDSCLAAREPI